MPCSQGQTPTLHSPGGHMHGSPPGNTPARWLPAHPKYIPGIQSRWRPRHPALLVSVETNPQPSSRAQGLMIWASERSNFKRKRRPIRISSGPSRKSGKPLAKGKRVPRNFQQEENLTTRLSWPNIYKEIAVSTQSPFLLFCDRKSGPRVETVPATPLPGTRGCPAARGPGQGRRASRPHRCCGRPWGRTPWRPPSAVPGWGEQRSETHPAAERVGSAGRRARRPAHRVTWLGAEQRIKGALWPRNKEPPRAQSRASICPPAVWAHGPLPGPPPHSSARPASSKPGLLPPIPDLGGGSVGALPSGRHSHSAPWLVTGRQVSRPQERESRAGPLPPHGASVRGTSRSPCRSATLGTGTAA
ncbi:uncharacterized protein LOC105866717 [Microcebus murinus]|uniref:uncharacterized protein LOC105866717 n=1 Tax=Microcebus murinus TaxID=30608 RepID=UPI003F6ADB0F